MSKNVAVFVDVANIFYAAKAAGVDIDYVTLLKSATAGRDFVRAYAYTGLDPDNENQRNFHNFLARNGYKVVSKDIRKYGDGRVKANLDIELVVDLMKTARNLDVAVVVSGDGDFAPAIRAVQEMGVRVEVVSFRGNTSSDLIEVADLFTDITQIARVEKGSTRSGRRVAGDQDDLSMTEVPDKQTEGATRGRTGRGRTGRGREAEPSRPRESEPVAARSGRRAASGAAAGAASGAAAGAASGGLVALPGEKLSKAVAPSEAAEPPTELTSLPDDEAASDSEVGEDGRRRRRRRRGGRGRGRGRGSEAVGTAAEPIETLEELPAAADFVPAARAPRPGAFGSVWDSQIGVPTGVGRGEPPIDEDDFDEPEIPEYLIAEQRRGRGTGGRGTSGGRGGSPGRGGRSAYVAALERERFGGGRGGGFNRYPDTSGRAPARPDQGRRSDRRDRPDRPPRRSSDEPWSEVPPEIEEMLRAQLDARAARGASVAGRASGPDVATESSPAEAAPPVVAAVATPTGRSRSTRSRAAAVEPAAGEPEAPTAKSTSSPTRRRTTKATASAATDADPTPAGTADVESGQAQKKPTTRRRTTKTAEPAAESPAATTAGDPDGTSAATAKPRRRTTRTTRTAPTGD